MIDDSKLKEAFALIAEVVTASYERGRTDAINAMLQAASGAMQQSPPQKLYKPLLHTVHSDVEEGRTRAPRGSAERVIKRALSDASVLGATVQEIMAAREGDLEMMLVDSSIRGELRRGEKSNPPKYVEIDGRWFEPS
jgi:hypothetical protein